MIEEAAGGGTAGVGGSCYSKSWTLGSLEDVLSLGGGADRPATSSQAA